MSAAEVARLFKVTSRTVARWSDPRQENPVLHELRTPGGHRRYRQVEVMALLRASASPGASEEEPG